MCVHVLSSCGNIKKTSAQTCYLINDISVANSGENGICFYIFLRGVKIDWFVVL